MESPPRKESRPGKHPSLLLNYHPSWPNKEKHRVLEIHIERALSLDRKALWKVPRAGNM